MLWWKVSSKRMNMISENSRMKIILLFAVRIIHLKRNRIKSRIFFQERLLHTEEGSGTREVLERWMDSHNLSTADFNRVMEVGSLHTIKELTKAGCGITFFI